jgi:hypothetical protein
MSESDVRMYGRYIFLTLKCYTDSDKYGTERSVQKLPLCCNIGPEKENTGITTKLVWVSYVIMFLRSTFYRCPMRTWREV